MPGWNWEQGRLDYFQFDELRKVARFGSGNNLRLATRSNLASAVGLEFLPDNSTYRPWRNYGRLFQIAMIATPQGRNEARLTALGVLLAEDGQITTDEYLHFLARATTQPSPALKDWDHNARRHRYPLLFALRFILARAVRGQPNTDIADIIRSYISSDFGGGEDLENFQSILDANGTVRLTGTRQSSESVKFLAQLSYLTATKKTVTVSLMPTDASALFNALEPVSGPFLEDRSSEIRRRAELYQSTVEGIRTDHRDADLSRLEEAGFDAPVVIEGRRIRSTHMTVERNRTIRERFFNQRPDHSCDLCGKDTRQTYPWTDRLLEVHHLLPLCSGARTSKEGTLLVDLVANCPSCHRAVHRYYEKWLAENSRVDFADASEAKIVYDNAKREHQCAVAAL